jgi:hypothetical protein
MPMPGLENLRPIGVVAQPGQNRREELIVRGHVRRNEKLLLVAMGGIVQRLPIERWSINSGVRYVVPASWGIERSDCISIESCGMSFSDLLASSDAIITKPGYGAFTEAAVNGISVLYVRRPDWPEEPCLIEWLVQHVRCQEVSRTELEQGMIERSLQSLLSQPQRAPVEGRGVIEAAEILREFLAVGD